MHICVWQLACIKKRLLNSPWDAKCLRCSTRRTENKQKKDEEPGIKSGEKAEGEMRLGKQACAVSRSVVANSWKREGGKKCNSENWHQRDGKKSRQTPRWWGVKNKRQREQGGVHAGQVMRKWKERGVTWDQRGFCRLLKVITEQMGRKEGLC